MIRLRHVRMLTLVAFAAALAPAVQASEPEGGIACAGLACPAKDGTSPLRLGAPDKDSTLPGADLPDALPVATVPGDTGTCTTTVGGPRADIPPGVCAMEFALPGDAVLPPVVPAGSGRAATLPLLPRG